MSAIDELRTAAWKERAEWGGSHDRRCYPQASALHLALADWLDAMARSLSGTSKGDVPLEDEALAVARAINGDAS